MERARTHLSLDTITVPTACPKRWDELAPLHPAEPRRWCETCCFHVTDLSALTRSEADAFLAARSDRTCVTFLRRGDGSIVTRAAGWKRFALPAWARVAAGLLALLAFLPGCCRRTMGRAAGIPCSDPAEQRMLGSPAPADVPVRTLGEMAAPDLPVEPEPGPQSR